MSLLFIPKVIHEHGEPWWNDDDNKGTHDSCTRNLWQSYQQSSGSKQKEWEKVKPCKVFLFILASDILHAIKAYNMGPPALLLLQRKVCCGFLSPLKIHRLGQI
jgi:hypothetical protein